MFINFNNQIFLTNKIYNNTVTIDTRTNANYLYLTEMGTHDVNPFDK